MLFVDLRHQPFALVLPKSNAQVFAASHEGWQFDFATIEVFVIPSVVTKSAKLPFIVRECDVHRYKFWKGHTAGEALAISIPASETRVIRHFQERMPYGLFVPDTP